MAGLRFPMAIFLHAECDTCGGEPAWTNHRVLLVILLTVREISLAIDQSSSTEKEKKIEK